jgi:hypothetical protein
MKKNKSHSRWFHLWVLVGLIILIAGAAAFACVAYREKQEIAKLKNALQNALSQTAENKQPPVENDGTSLLGKDILVTIRKKEAGGTTQIIAFKDYNYQLVKYKDWLIFEQGYNRANVFINSYNVKTGQSKMLFDQLVNSDLGQRKGEGKSFEVESLLISGDKLYFSVTGGYLERGATFVIPLNPFGAPKKISDVSGRIEMMNGQLWLIAGFGFGAGTVSETRNLIDPATDKVTEINTTQSDFGIGENLLGQTKEILIIGKTISDKNAAVDGPGVYDSVSAVSISKPTEPKDIVSSAAMPKDVHSVKYDSANNRLFLLGQEFYTFDLATKKLEKIIADQLFVNPAYINGWQGNKVCVNGNYQIDLTAKTIVRLDKICYVYADAGLMTEKETAEKIFHDLHLPAEFEIEVK